MVRASVADLCTILRNTRMILPGLGLCGVAPAAKTCNNAVYRLLKIRGGSVESARLVKPDQIDQWIPASTLVSSQPGRWDGLDLTTQAHVPWGGEVPALRDNLITVFMRPGHVRRHLDGPWQNEEVEPGDVSFIPSAMASTWYWNDPLENIHLHISDRYLGRIAREMFGHDFSRVTLADKLKIADPHVAFALGLLADEARRGGEAEHLYVDAIATQLCVHILRRYSSHRFPLRRASTGLGAAQAARVAEYIEAGLSQSLSVGSLAGIAGVSCFHFSRQFKATFGSPPHSYVLARRLERARVMLLSGEQPIKKVAAACGFYDAAHMTRLFQKRFGSTPGATRTHNQSDREIAKRSVGSNIEPPGSRRSGAVSPPDAGYFLDA